MAEVKKQPGLGKELKEGGFKKAYHSLPHNKLKEARAEICRLCYWNEGTFRMKLSGRIPFRVYEIMKIEDFFTGQNLSAWTGELLNKN